MLDVRTMVVMLLLSTATTALFMLFAQRGQQRVQGIHYWAWAYLFLTAGFLLIASRDYIHNHLSIALANCLLFLSFGLMVEAVAAVLQIPSRHRHAMWIGSVLACVVFVSAYWLGFNYQQRVMLISIIVSAMALYIGLLLLRGCGPNEPARKALGSAFFLMLGLLFGRLLVGIFGLSSSQTMTDRSWAETVFYTLLFVLLFGNAVGFMLMARERLVHDLALRATTDALTGAYNRHAFEPIAIAALAQIDRHLQPVSLLMIDLDHFKAINDRYGHLAGDEVLKTITQIIRHELRVGDVLGRYGGEEMSLLLPGTDAESARKIAERIRHRIETTVIEWRRVVIRVTASIGIATAIQSGSLENVLHAADKSLYAAKAAGRNQVYQQSRSTAA